MPHQKFLIRQPLYILISQKDGIGLVYYQHLSMNAYVGSLKLHLEEHLIFIINIKIKKIRENITYIYPLEKYRTTNNNDNRKKHSFVFYIIKGLQ